MDTKYERLKVASRMIRDVINETYRTESIEIDLPDKLASWAFTYCAAHDLTPSEMIEEAVRSSIDAVANNNNDDDDDDGDL